MLNGINIKINAISVFYMVPSIHIIQTMANVLGTSVEYLTRETDNTLPISYLIEVTSDPELFYMIDIYKKSNTEDKNRFLEYVKDYRQKSSTSS